MSDELMVAGDDVAMAIEETDGTVGGSLVDDALVARLVEQARAGERSAAADERIVALAEQYNPDLLTVTRDPVKKHIRLLVDGTGERAKRVRIVHGKTLKVQCQFTGTMTQSPESWQVQVTFGDFGRGDELTFWVVTDSDTEPDHKRFELVWENGAGEILRRQLMA